MEDDSSFFGPVDSNQRESASSQESPDLLVEDFIEANFNILLNHQISSVGRGRPVLIDALLSQKSSSISHNNQHTSMQGIQDSLEFYLPKKKQKKVSVS